MFIARRFKDDGPEIILPGLEWQMPQGGIDADEDPRPAAVRELYEETGVTSVKYLGETPDWMTYDFPPYDGPPHRLAVFRGQRQKWFAFRFTGDEREIVVTDWRNGQEPEFDAWRWERLEQRRRRWWCRSGARSTRRWRGSLRGLPELKLSLRQPLEARQAIRDVMERLLVDRIDRHLRTAEETGIVERADLQDHGRQRPAGA